MIAAMLLAVPMAAVWVLVLGNASPENFGIGLIIGFVTAIGLGLNREPVKLRRVPDQCAALITYFVILVRDIFVSSIDVARIVLSRDLPVNPGLIAVPTQDETKSNFTAALSAHGITVTPGELVVDFDNPKALMYVHCLNKETSEQSAHAAQTRRLHLLRRIEGKL